ncbi:MAG: hypothetical protein J6P72_00540 [Firmicutes bacterium]|nr:hypothetical protein [Bacillota bacterium]
MKKLFAVLMVLMLSVLMAVPAFAADGVSTDEEALKAEFDAVVDKWVGVVGDKNGLQNQYKTEAANALAKVELDKAACDDLSATIKAVDALLSSKGVANRSDLRNALPEVLSLVNKTANKYGMTVEVNNKRGDAKDGYATVTVKINGTTAAETAKPVNQTGFGLVQTVAVCGVVVALVAGAVITARKQRLFA